MSGRQPIIRIPSVGAPQTGADQVSFARDAAQNPLAGGRLVDATFAATNFGLARHGLGRRMRGAIVVGATAAHGSEFVAIVDDPVASFPQEEWLTLSSSTAYTGTVRVWVFATLFAALRLSELTA